MVCVPGLIALAAVQGSERTGMFLNMVMPTAKVVQMLDPSHRPQASTCTRAATFTGTNSVERAAMMTAAPTQASLTCSTCSAAADSAKAHSY